MRGILHAQDDKANANTTVNATTTCVNITHSPSLATLTDWDSEDSFFLLFPSFIVSSGVLPHMILLSNHV